MAILKVSHRACPETKLIIGELDWNNISHKCVSFYLDRVERDFLETAEGGRPEHTEVDRVQAHEAAEAAGACTLTQKA